MRTVNTIPNVGADISNQFLEDDFNLDLAEKLVKNEIANYMSSQIHKKLFHQNSSRSYCQKIRVLKAVPARNEGDNVYVYSEEGKLLSVQDWVNKFDMNTNALIVAVPNLNFGTLSSRRALIFHPEHGVHTTRPKTVPKVKVFVPDFGYVDDNPKLLRVALAAL